jgi:hypothetical protein
VRTGDQIRVALHENGQQLLFYRDAENVELPEITSNIPSEASRPDTPNAEPASQTPPIVAGFWY